MIRNIIPIKDSTIYELYPNKNTGIDQILEVGYDINFNTENRSLIQFSINDIIDRLDLNYNYKCILKLFTSHEYQIPQDLKLYLYPTSTSWSQGTGKYINNPETTDGVNWNSDGTNVWVSGSFNTVDGGGSWYPNYEVEYQINNLTKDVEFDVTDIINNWVSGSFNNDGFIVKLKSNEVSQSPNLKFYSLETHTIYQPQLLVEYDESEYVTGSFANSIVSGSINPHENFIISVKNRNKEIAKGMVYKLYIQSREAYPQLTFGQQNEYKNNRALPSTTYYSIMDLHTNEFVIPFSEYTKVSLNPVDGHYLYFDTNILYPEKYYKLLFKVKFDDYTEQIVDSKYNFKIIYSPITIVSNPIINYFLTITSDLSGLTFSTNEEIMITWLTNNVGNVDIELLKGGTVVETIVSGFPDVRYYKYFITDNVISGTDYSIRVRKSIAPTILDEIGEFTINSVEYLLLENGEFLELE